MEQATLVQWLIIYLISSLWWKWILSWGGAEKLEGIKAWFMLGWFAGHWTAEQIRLYALIIWILHSIWFVAGVFFPVARAPF